jgi:hypothetical protein
MLHPKPRQSIPMLTTITITEGSDNTRANFARLHIQASTHLQDHLCHNQTSGRGPLGQPGYPSIQITALIVAGHPRIQHHPLIPNRRRDVDQNRL